MTLSFDSVFLPGALAKPMCAPPNKPATITCADTTNNMEYEEQDDHITKSDT